ncbi:MAG TPA: D-glycero-beta-D-manno-heptose-7-phosphate kinase [Rhodocyclaceae bacterium]|jgi:rfaE bifunctional protein kinase chain/domain|nr:D-glycero-beta-D-manno-heptose-7-phosphate kinase [Rhodocyclaceae bacterium]
MKIPVTATTRVLVVGDVMLDRYWFGDVSRISPEAPVPVVKIDKMEERPGGAANVARNCAALGAKTTLLSVVGADDAGRALSRLMHDAGIAANLHEDTKLSTTVKLRVLGRQQQLLRIDFENWPDHDVLNAKLAGYRRLLAETDVVILSDYGKGALVHVAEMIRLARAAGKPVLVDPKGDDYARYTEATLLTPNRSELREVVGKWKDEADLQKRAQTLRAELKLDALLVTRSEDGMTLFTETEASHDPAQVREVFDVSGAGDTVIATLAVMLGSGSDMLSAMHLANRAAGVVVAKLGTATCSLDELAAVIAQDKE